MNVDILPDNEAGLAALRDAEAHCAAMEKLVEQAYADWRNSCAEVKKALEAVEPQARSWGR